MLRSYWRFLSRESDEIWTPTVYVSGTAASLIEAPRLPALLFSEGPTVSVLPKLSVSQTRLGELLKNIWILRPFPGKSGSVGWRRGSALRKLPQMLLADGPGLGAILLVKAPTLGGGY